MPSFIVVEHELVKRIFPIPEQPKHPMLNRVKRYFSEWYCSFLCPVLYCVPCLYTTINSPLTHLKHIRTREFPMRNIREKSWQIITCNWCCFLQPFMLSLIIILGWLLRILQKDLASEEKDVLILIFFFNVNFNICLKVNLKTKVKNLENDFHNYFKMQLWIPL